MFACNRISDAVKLAQIATAALLITSSASFALGLSSFNMPNLQFPESGAFSSKNGAATCQPPRCPQPEVTKNLNVRK